MTDLVGLDALLMDTPQHQPLRIWWRDDDATEPNANLDRLLKAARDFHLPLALAVIPMRAEPSLREAIAGTDQLWVLQHGTWHDNHAGANDRKCEFPASRDLGDAQAALTQGRERHKHLWSERALDVLVPPWNRMADTIKATLPALGFSGYSAWQSSRTNLVVKGLREADTHIDMMDWGEGAPKSVERVAKELAKKLTERRRDPTHASQPLGLLTHHKILDQAGWATLETILRHIATHKSVQWLSARDIFTSG